MRKVICVIAVMGLTVAWAAPAQAASHNLNSTIKIAAVKSTGSPPYSGSSEYAGTFKGGLGSGAIVGHLSFNPPAFHGGFRVYLKQGTLKGNMEGTGAPNSGGGIDVSGGGEITKGSGKYKGAHGKFTFSGGRPADPPIDTISITGSVKY